MSTSAIDQLATALNEIPPEELEDAGVPAEFLSQAARRNYTVICSIYPRDLVSKPYTHGRGLRHYRLPSGSPHKPSYLRVLNTYMRLQATTQINPDERPGLTMQPIPSDLIAKDLVQEWGGDHPANRQGFIGVAIIAGDTATPDEIRRMRDAQDNFARAIVNKADRDDANNVQGANYDAARFWAEYLGVRDPKAHRWYRIHEPKTYQKCPFCAEDIVTEATVCKECSKDLVAEALKGDPRIETDRWPEVARVLKLMQGATKPTQPVKSTAAPPPAPTSVGGVPLPPTI